jgi:stage V sporulation protein R
MELVDLRTKAIMEECRRRAEKAGLNIQGETLEYIVTNRDLIELSPKIMIPTLYDYWVNDVKVIRDKWVYGVYPHNPYETAINTRPAISFYNDNNPDWLNTMIFYHVLGHHDFFHNNVFFKRTWDDDFCGEALADKRLLNRIREDMGAKKRWVDYVVEFARGTDNLVGYYAELEEVDKAGMRDVFGIGSERSNFYFGEFLRIRYEEKIIALKFYYDEIFV